MLEEIKRYDPYTDKFIKNPTTSRIEVGTDGRLYNLSLSNTYGLYARIPEELDKCDYIDKSVKLFTKEEVIAMLTELQLEIEEKFNDRPFSYNHHQRTEFYRDIDEIIQEKINSLKEGKDG